jgi:hypothetical protein
VVGQREVRNRDVKHNEENNLSVLVRSWSQGKTTVRITTSKDNETYKKESSGTKFYE